MKINTSIMEQTARLRSDLKLGRPVLVRNQQKTSLIFAVETLKKNIPTEIKNNYLGVSHLTITARRAKTLTWLGRRGTRAQTHGKASPLRCAGAAQASHLLVGAGWQPWQRQAAGTNHPPTCKRV